MKPTLTDVLFLAFLAFLAGVLLAFKKFEKLIRWVIQRQEADEERISKLEVADASDEERISKLEENEFQHDKTIRSLKVEVKELGQDVGWADSARKTEVLKLPDPPKE